ncbi:hypothetical protein DENSPDRAFT_843237 [Dentipellis sp. KUC8613]|nr:hypothetical protein DENSPDRAFT_843237 [Dentipellis sp. KUC8613]
MHTGAHTGRLRPDEAAATAESMLQSGQTVSQQARPVQQQQQQQRQEQQNDNSVPHALHAYPYPSHPYLGHDEAATIAESMLQNNQAQAIDVLRRDHAGQHGYPAQQQEQQQSMENTYQRIMLEEFYRDKQRRRERAYARMNPYTNTRTTEEEEDDDEEDDEDDETPLQFWLRNGPSAADVEAQRYFGQPAHERLRTHGEIWTEFCVQRRMGRVGRGM